MIEIESLAWNKSNGLLPAIIQDAETAQVLMLGYMNKEALQQTLRSKKVTFYSRSKQRLWQKGETSGHFLELVNIVTDCDQDSLLIQAKPAGPCCHLQTISCFHNTPTTNIFLWQLWAHISDRKKQPISDSYTAKLFQAGTQRIAQKVGEEGVEVALAAMTANRNEIINETADLIFHLLVLLQQCDIGLIDVLQELQNRNAKKILAQKINV